MEYNKLETVSGDAAPMRKIFTKRYWQLSYWILSLSLGHDDGDKTILVRL